MADGMTFEEFIMCCARGMGALITMCDDPSNAEIPKAFKSSDYNKKRLKETETELKRLLIIHRKE